MVVLGGSALSYERGTSVRLRFTSQAVRQPASEWVSESVRKAVERQVKEQLSRFRVPGFEFRVSGSGFRVHGFGTRVSCSVFRVSGFGFRVVCSGFRVYDLEFMLHALVFCGLP